MVVLGGPGCVNQIRRPELDRPDAIYQDFDSLLRFGMWIWNGGGDSDWSGDGY